MLWPNKGLAAGVGAGAQEPRSEGVGVCAWVPGAAGDGAGGTRWLQGGAGERPAWKLTVRSKKPLLGP